MATNIGTYKGVEIRPGTDLEVQEQMKKIDMPNQQSTTSSANVGSSLIERANTLGKEASAKTGIAFNPIPNPITAPDTNTTGTPTPTLPTPTASNINETFINSLSKVQEGQRKSIESAYQSRISEIDKKREEAKRNIDEITTLQSEGVLQDMSELSAPYREALEKSERERLYINENFEANQKLTNELDSLLTEGNELIKQQKQLPIATAFKNPRVNKTIEDVNARAGVIQAVMSARNNQIGVAETMIDRSVNAINADRKDQLNYYTTLLNFYQNQRDEENNKLISLDKDKENYLKAQIGLIESDLERSNKTADFIKELMLSPESATLAADAGISLNDSVETINQKISKQTVRNEIRKVIQDATESGASSGTILAMSKAGSVEEAQQIAAKSGVYQKKTGSGTSGSGSDEWDYARSILNANPDASDAELKSALLENTNLSSTEINSIIAERKQKNPLIEFRSSLESFSATGGNRDSAIQQVVSDNGYGSEKDIPPDVMSLIDEVFPVETQNNNKPWWKSAVNFVTGGLIAP